MKTKLLKGPLAHLTLLSEGAIREARKLEKRRLAEEAEAHPDRPKEKTEAERAQIVRDRTGVTWLSDRDTLKWFLSDPNGVQQRIAAKEALQNVVERFSNVEDKDQDAVN